MCNEGVYERWDCHQKMSLYHFCVILNKTSFSEAKLLGFYGKISKNHNKSKGLFFNLKMPTVYM